MKRKQTLHQLTKAEEEIMQVIWDLGPCLVREIIERLGQPDLPHSTVSSVVRILEKKGFVNHKAFGKTHQYFPVITREAYAESNVQSLMDRFFSGSPQQLVSFLVEKENLDLQTLNNLLKNLPKK